ncbi:MAG TPA: 2-C-methyl-D-erythritol 4-phosphate cytidylyltransferase, partial [Xanthomonadaceae bacterium]|nr:2-C-methyl-D-erythritol 4-phosphate cytidylyltransferase [Xanthomonadaceae bacterium]
MITEQVRAGLWVIVPAAGRGMRFGGQVPKQYVTVAGRPLLAHALGALLAHPGVSGAVVVLSADDAHWPGWESLAGKPIRTCIGGEARADSVLAGLAAMPE